MIRENWGSRFGFIMATAGFAIGMGNIWRFPYIVGESGGGAFLLVYLVITVIIGVPLLTAEISLGRKAQLTPIKGMQKLTARKSFWVSIGWVEIIAALIITSYYLMILAWVAVYFVEYASGKLSTLNAVEMSQNFNGLVANPLKLSAYSLVIAILIGIIIARGLQGGIEKVAKIFMPMLLIFFVVLAIGSNTFEGSFEGLIWYLSPDFSKINERVILAALGQVFFSIGVGLAGGYVFGSYLPKDSDVPGSVALVVIFDTAIAIIAGLVIFPALFAFNLQPDSGAGLLFVTMATLFNKVPLGNAIGSLFFFLIFVAGLTSIIGLIEAVVATLMDSMNIKRKKSVWLTVPVCFVLSIPSILSFGPWQNIKILGRTLFELFDFVSGSILLPLGALLMVLYVGHVWKFKPFQEYTNQGSSGVRVNNFWGFFLKYLIPIVIFIILINGLLGATPG